MLSTTVLSLVASILVTANAAWINPTVKTGLDIVIQSNYSALAGKKVLVLTNPTGITPELDLGVDVMVTSRAVNLVGVMGPEHGFRGTSAAGGGESTFVDQKTGLTVYVRHASENPVLSTD